MPAAIRVDRLCHEYGTALPEQDRRALVEHLKTL